MTFDELKLIKCQPTNELGDNFHIFDVPTRDYIGRITLISDTSYFFKPSPTVEYYSPEVMYEIYNYITYLNYSIILEDEIFEGME